MSRMVIKTARDRDQYLIWSSVVDNAVAGPGTREQVAHWLATEDRVRWEPHEIERILAKADEHGSSACARDGWWDDETLSVGEGSPSDGWYHIRRERLGEYADALERGDDMAAVALLECWQRHDEDDSDADGGVL